MPARGSIEPAASAPGSPQRARRRLAKLAGHSLVYGLGGIGAKLVGLLLLPLYTHAVTPAEYGEVEAVTAAIAVAAIALRLGLVTAMYRFSWDDPSREGRRRVIQTAFWAVMALSTAGLLVNLAAVQPVASILRVDPTLAAIGAFGLWINMNYDLLSGVYRIEQRPTAFVVFSFANLGLTVLLSLVLVFGLDLGAAGIMAGNFAGSYVVFAFLVVARRETLGLGRFDRDLLAPMLRFSLPLMPAGIALWALNVADRYQVQHLASQGELGTYSAAAKVALGIMLPITAFQTAWVPFANAIRDDEDARATFRLVFWTWSSLLGWMLVAISLLTPPYVHLMPRAWWDAAPVVPLLAGGSFLYGAYMILSFGVNRTKRTYMTPVVTGTAAAVNIGLNFALIPAYGTLGAGASTVIGYAVLALLGWWNAQHVFPVPQDWGRVARIALVVVGLIAVSLAVLPQAGPVALALRLLVVAAYPLALAALGVVAPAEWRRLPGALRTMRARRRPRRREEEPEGAESEAASPV